MPLRPGAM